MSLSKMLAPSNVRRQTEKARALLERGSDGQAREQASATSELALRKIGPDHPEFPLAFNVLSACDVHLLAYANADSLLHDLIDCCTSTTLAHTNEFNSARGEAHTGKRGRPVPRLRHCRSPLPGS